MGIIRYSRLGDFEYDDVAVIKGLGSRYMEKLERHLPGLVVDFVGKLHKIGGRVKYSFHARVNDPSFLFKADAHDWDLRRAVHKTFGKLENELKHKFRTEGKPKIRSPGHIPRRPRFRIRAG